MLRYDVADNSVNSCEIKAGVYAEADGEAKMCALGAVA